MSNEIVIGDVEWNKTSNGKGKSEFMKLEQGTSTVRILSNPFQIVSHWIENNGKKRKITSPVGNPALVKKLETAGFPAKLSWIIKVIDRSDDSFKLLEIGPQIKAGVLQTINNKKWGNPTNFDFSIVRGKPGVQPLYTVTPEPKEPLDPSIKAKFMEFSESVDLEKMNTPATEQFINDFMGWKTSDSDESVGDDEATEGDIDFNFTS